MHQHQRNLEYFVELSLGELPLFFNELTSEQVTHLRQFMEHVLRQEEEALRNMFKSLSMLINYVPNIILKPIIPKYFAPSIAAMITQELSSKQIIGLVSGLPVSYVGDTAIYLDAELAAEILIGLKTKMSMQVIEYTINKYPLKSLDILRFVSEKEQQIAAKFFNSITLNINDLMPERLEIYNKLIGGVMES